MLRQARFQDDDWKTLEQLSQHVRRGLRVFDQYSLQQLQDSENSFVAVTTNITVSVVRTVCVTPFHDRRHRCCRCGQVLFCLLAVVFYAFVYLPMLRRLNDNIMANRVLLTLLPNDVVAGCKDVKEGISAIISKLR
jgi:hypothetical protein